MNKNDTKKFTLIMPMINTSPEYENCVPIEFRENEFTGVMLCLHSLAALDLSQFTDIVFVMLKKHNDKYNIKNKIIAELQRDNDSYKDVIHNANIKFLIAEQPTSSQAETVISAIRQLNITGPIFIKDADNMCKCTVTPGNSILTYPIENLEIIDPQHKSYVDIDDNNFITNIIEKRVISGLISSGGYGFDDASKFVEGYKNVKTFSNIKVLNKSDKYFHIYISHIIYWLMLFQNEKFRPIEVTIYDDYKVRQLIN